MAALGEQPIDTWDVVFKPEIVSKLKDCGVTLLDVDPGEDTNGNGAEINRGTRDGVQPFLNNNVPLGASARVPLAEFSRDLTRRSFEKAWREERIGPAHRRDERDRPHVSEVVAGRHRYSATTSNMAIRFSIGVSA